MGATVEEVLHDYYICCMSREVSLYLRRDVLTGRAKFGVADDGKELFQIAMAKQFRKGDFRADYYRGHTLLLALDICTVEDLFAQLYADSENDPFSYGRQMNNHHATPLIDEHGNWLNHLERYNLSSDISTTGGQVARGLGLAFASKKYRENQELSDTPFSDNGNEVCFCIIGDASTSEGAFWETVNAAGVLQVPLTITISDDGYGISVPKSYQTTKESISDVLQGFAATDETKGIDIHKVKGWDYPALCEAYSRGTQRAREDHAPVVFHIEELTQPQGHSTSGSHERYKSKERLEWEAEYDCNVQFRQWILANGVATEEALADLEKQADDFVKAGRDRAWKAFREPIQAQWNTVNSLFDSLAAQHPDNTRVSRLRDEVKGLVNPFYAELVKAARQLLYALRGHDGPEIAELRRFVEESHAVAQRRFHANLYSESPRAALKVPHVTPIYSDDSPVKNGFEVINAFFDKMLEKNPAFYAFGEDLGKIGGVNQGFAGLQDKYGETRVFDTGIREWTIIGQAIGMAMRGLRPLAEIQYLDYLIYAFSPLSDDLASLRYRTNGIQAAPVLIRTRGHRLEGIWHSGSPMSILLGGLRGIYILTPRNFVQAAGLYNTMLQSDDPALLIECLNAYRLKERLPDNIGEYTVPLGTPEILRHGADVTIVTYASCVRIAQSAIEMLENDGIDVELIDIQTLVPFDLPHTIVASLQKTNRIVFLDEDLPGGASAYMMQQVLEVQNGYRYLDSPPVTVTAQPHRPPYGTDGDYFSKPNAEDVYDAVFKLMIEAEPVHVLHRL
ncbi:MAG: transketolase [Saprospiraceae bacterium]|nr:transketolase [Saprospiraceae bacterium]